MKYSEKYTYRHVNTRDMYSTTLCSRFSSFEHRTATHADAHRDCAMCDRVQTQDLKKIAPLIMNVKTEHVDSRFFGLCLTIAQSTCKR